MRKKFNKIIQKIFSLTLYNSKRMDVEYSINSYKKMHSIENSDDEDGINKGLQRAGGCCEPVSLLNIPSTSELARRNSM